MEANPVSPHQIVVFDAYGTLFDVAGAARLAASEAGGEALAKVWPMLAEAWRRKQLEYTWLRTLMGSHADFAQVTADALDWALAELRLADPNLRARLLALYDALPAYPEVPQALSSLKAKGYRLAILSNGTPGMLRSAVTAAGIGDLIEAILSVEEVGAYKPLSRTYHLVEARTGAPRDKVFFVSSNGWDAAGAAHYGFTAIWVNRLGQPVDRLPTGPAHIVPDLSHLMQIV
jgi:2-haloacid dehalogenase